MKSNYQIIYLNGPSSAGKTPLARALQNYLSEPFLVFGLDQMIFMMPDKLNDWNNFVKTPGFSLEAVIQTPDASTGYRIHAGPYGLQILQTLKEVVVALATAGNKVIIDDVSLGKHEVDEWRHALKDFKVLWIGVTAPLEILQEREKIRGDRHPGLAQWQYDKVHAGVVYDGMVDTYQNNLEQCVTTISDMLTDNQANMSHKS
jgi:chloramphenicol 3-O phosphotransferase